MMSPINFNFRSPVRCLHSFILILAVLSFFHFLIDCAFSQHRDSENFNNNNYSYDINHVDVNSNSDPTGSQNYGKANDNNNSAGQIDESKNLNKNDGNVQLNNDRVSMTRHSWNTSKDILSGSKDWVMGMTSILSNDKLILLPAVGDRVGEFWNLSPVNTNEFEIIFKFQVTYVTKVTTVDDMNTINTNSRDIKNGKSGFALWYIFEKPDPILADHGADSIKTSSTTQSTSDSINFTQKFLNRIFNNRLFGYKTNPKGLGVFFSILDRENTFNPSISVLFSPDGNEEVNIATGVPTNNGVYFKFVNNFDSSSTPQANQPNREYLFRLSVSDKRIMGSISNISNTKPNFQTCFDIPTLNQSVQKGYIGFTAYNGPYIHTFANDGSLRRGSYIYTISQFLMTNLNINKIAEEFPINEKVAHELREDDLSDIFKEHSNIRDSKERYQIISQLERSIQNLVAKQIPVYQGVLKSVVSIQQNIDQIFTELRQLRQIFLSGNKTVNFNSDAVAKVKDEIFGIKNLLTLHSERHSKTLDYLTSKFAKNGTHIGTGQELRDLVDKASRLEAVIHNKNLVSSMLSFALIVSLICLALFVWKKFRDMEKKHLL